MLVLGSLNPDFWLYLGFYLNHVTLLKNEPGVCSWVLTFILLSEKDVYVKFNYLNNVHVFGNNLLCIQIIFKVTSNYDHQMHVME